MDAVACDIGDVKRLNRATATDSMPTSLAVGSNPNNSNQDLRVLTDLTDAQGIRHVELETTAIGKTETDTRAQSGKPTAGSMPECILWGKK